MRHIIALSGGKDSTALAIYLTLKNPDVDYELCFADTGRELPDLYRFLDDVEKFLGKHIHRITDYGRGFSYYLHKWNYFLPGLRSRWCTKHLKIRPFERFVGEKVNGRFKRDATVYIGLRADEMDREGNYGIEGVTYKYPFQDDGIDLAGVKKILADTCLKLPDFYAWRSTGGCYMCPWQRARDWKGLKDHYPDLYAQSVAEEERAGGATWSISRLTLKEIITEAERQMKLFPQAEEDSLIDKTPCLICAK